jgi:beta-aspartyl-peptidase (threonine type)
MTPVIVVHGGAGRISVEYEADARIGIARAAEAGQALLIAGGSAEEAAVAAVRVLEDDATFNAGRGSCMTDAGTFEADAGIMRSIDMRSGAIAAVPDLADAINVARAVMQRGAHRFFAGPGAVQHARELGVGRFGREHVFTEKAHKKYEEAMAGRSSRDGQADTVGAVTLDAAGHLCSACSTGGVLLKHPGRVGDTPLIGSGFYAAPDLGAAGATGMGEAILTHVLSFAVLQRIAAGEDPQRVAAAMCEQVATRHGATCGLILVTPDGRTAIAHASDHMSWARAVGDAKIESGLTAVL